MGSVRVRAPKSNKGTGAAWTSCCSSSTASVWRELPPWPSLPCSCWGSSPSSSCAPRRRHWRRSIPASPSRTSSAIVSELQTQNITYELRGDGDTILVPRDQITATRMTLAQDGLPHPRPGRLRNLRPAVDAGRHQLRPEHQQRPGAGGRAGPHHLLAGPYQERPRPPRHARARVVPPRAEGPHRLDRSLGPRRTLRRRNPRHPASRCLGHRGPDPGPCLGGR